MELSITSFCRNLAAFCNHIESRSNALSDSIRRRPIPLDSAATSFLQSLQRRVSSAAADLEILDDMARGTVSFEELLGHSNEVYKANQNLISQIEDRFKSFGYVPQDKLDMDGGDEEDAVAEPKWCISVNGSGDISLDYNLDSPNRNKIEDDQLFEDSISLQNLGLSEAALATIASEGDAPTTVIQISRDDFDSLPSYMKSLASWEELEDAVSKINSYNSRKHGARKSPVISQHDLETLELGRKGRSYLLLLLRMNKLVAETIDGSVFYRVRSDSS